MAADRTCTPEMAKKVYYEFAMFEFLYQQLRLIARESPIFLPGKIVEFGTSPMATDERREVFAQLESFLLHVRVLRDFFYEQPKLDDVAASHFVPDWSTHCPKKGAYLISQKKRLDKALAHLSSKRLDYDAREKKWEVTTLYEEIQPAIKLFVERLPEDRKAWFCEPPEQEF